MKCPFCRQKRKKTDDPNIPCCSGGMVKIVDASPKIRGRKNPHRSHLQKQVILGLQSKFRRMMKRKMPKDTDANPEDKVEEKTESTTA